MGTTVSLIPFGGGGGGITGLQSRAGGGREHIGGGGATQGIEIPRAGHRGLESPVYHFKAVFIVGLGHEPRDSVGSFNNKAELKSLVGHSFE